MAVLNSAMRGRALIGPGLLLAGLAGCQSSPPVPVSTAPTADTTPSPLADAGDCRRRIEATVLTDVTTIDAVDECRFIAGGAQAARDVLTAGGTRDVLWAATWVYGSSGAEPAPLRLMLTNSDASIRVMAAAALARLGDASGLAALAAALSETDYVAGAYPPMPVARFAELTLARYVDGADVPGGPAATGDTSSLTTSWQSWLAANMSALTYDPSTGEWSRP